MVQSLLMSIDARLKALGIELPEPPQAGGNYVAAKRVGQTCYLSGVVSAHRGTVLEGVVGGDRSVQDGYYAARACGMSHLAVLRTALGSLDEVESIVSVTGFVNCVRGFTETPAVLNGYTDLMVDVFGDGGRPTRAAVGVAALPRHAMVETQAIVALKAKL